MPPLPDVSDVVRVALIGKLDDDTDVVNRFYMQYFTGAAPTNLNAPAATTFTDWGTDLKALFGASYSLTEVTMEDLTNSTAPVGASSGSTAGTRAGTKVSASACVIVRFHIDRRYRGGHPRAYLAAGTSNDLTTEQDWSGALLTAAAAGWATFIGHVAGALNTAYGATDFQHVNVSYYAGFTNITPTDKRFYSVPTLRDTPLVDTVVSYTTNPKVGSQRRRNQTP